MRNDSLFYKNSSPVDYFMRSRLMWMRFNAKLLGGMKAKGKDLCSNYPDNAWSLAILTKDFLIKN